MENIKEKIKKELEELLKEGIEILNATSKEKASKILIKYQRWYTKSLNLVKQTISERYQEFQEQYELEKVNPLNYHNYRIINYLLGYLPVYKGKVRSSKEGLDIFKSRFSNQIAILSSAQDKIDSTLADVEGVLQHDLFDNELEAAGELLKNGYKRAAGALASVTLEVHLAKVVRNHKIKITKKKPSIGDYNQELKKENVYDDSKFQFILWLSSIRKLCVHKKEREPTKDEVQKLINGVKEVVKTIF